MSIPRLGRERGTGRAGTSLAVQMTLQLPSVHSGRDNSSVLLNFSYFVDDGYPLGRRSPKEDAFRVSILQTSLIVMLL